jgi:hypothetical protein
MIMEISMKEIKKNMLTPAEKWVNSLIDGVASETHPSGTVEWYDKDGEWLFTQDFKSGFLFVDYNAIWLVLENYFGLKDCEINDLLTKALYDYTDKGNLRMFFH